MRLELRAVLLAQRQVLAELAELRETVQHHVRRTMATSDRRAGTQLLPLIEERLGSAPFTGPVLFAAVLNDPTPCGRALLELIVDQAEQDAGMRAFGKLLARLDGIELAGYRLVPAGTRREGRAWRVVQVSSAGNLQP